MSLVAAFSMNNHPGLIGDLLTSSEEDPQKSLCVPTVGDVKQVFPPGSGFVPSGMTQKISIINERLVIGWVGSMMAARVVIKELIQHSATHGSFSWETLSEFFANAQALIGKESVSFAGFLLDSNGTRQFSFGQHMEFGTVFWGRVVLLGSGDADAARMFSTDMRFPHSMSDSDNIANRVVATSLAFAGALLSREISDFSTLANYYGAGYEVVTLDGKVFTKVGDITHIFWFGELDERGIRIKPVHAVKYAYAGEFLTIRAATFESTNWKKARGRVDQRIFVVPPIHRPITQFPKDTAIPSMNSEWSCHYFCVNHQNDISVHATVHHSGGSTSPVLFEEDERKAKLAISVNKEFLESKLKDAFNTYSWPAEFHLFGEKKDDRSALLKTGSIVLLGVGLPIEVEGYTCTPYAKEICGYSELKRYETRYPCAVPLLAGDLPKDLSRVQKVKGYTVHPKNEEPYILKLTVDQKEVHRAFFMGKYAVFRRCGVCARLDLSGIPARERFTLIFDWSDKHIGAWASWVDESGRVKTFSRKANLSGGIAGTILRLLDRRD